MTFVNHKTTPTSNAPITTPVLPGRPVRRPGAAHLALHPGHPIADDLDDVLITRRSLTYLFAGGLQALLGSPQVLTPRLLRRLGSAAATYDERPRVDDVRSAAL